MTGSKVAAEGARAAGEAGEAEEGAEPPTLTPQYLCSVV